MTDSDFTFENGEPIQVGNHGTHDFVYADGTPVPDEGVSTVVFEDGVGIGQGTVVWACNNSGDVYELDYNNDFAVVRSSNVGFQTHGAGGDFDTVWVGEQDTGNFYKLDADDFSIAGSGSIPIGVDDTISDIGGDSTVAYALTEETDELFIIDADTLNVTTTVDASGETFNPGGIGGTVDKVWYSARPPTTDGDNYFAERDPSDLSIIRSRNDYPGGRFIGAGGSENKIYVADDADNPSNPQGQGTASIYELDPSDLSVIRSVSEPFDIWGIGGM